MLQDSEKFEQYAKMAFDGERQYKELEEQASKELSATKSLHLTTPDFEKFEEVMRAKNQAPFDMVAELKAINERLDADHRERMESEKAGKKRDRKTLLIASLTLIATVIIGAITIWLQLSQQPSNTPSLPPSAPVSASTPCDPEN